jgi:hypothetical protein
MFTLLSVVILSFNQRWWQIYHDHLSFSYKFYWRLILYLPNSDLELYSHILVLLLSHCNFYHLTNIDGKFTVIKYHDEISWSFDSILPNGDVELKLLLWF